MSLPGRGLTGAEGREARLVETVAGGNLPTWLRLGALTPSIVSSRVARECWNKEGS